MAIQNVGDLATSFQLRRDTGQVKADLVRLTGELSSGVVSDRVSHFKGDFSPLASLENGLARMDAYRSVIADFDLFVSTQQSAINTLRDLGQVSNTFLALPDAANDTLITNAGADALSRFEAAIRGLNTQVAGRSVFSGIETNQPAVADADALLSALEAEILGAGAVTADDVDTTVAAWFDPGGGFDTTGYLGGAASTTSIQLSDGETARVSITAEDGAIREYLSSLAMGALLGRDVLDGNLQEQGVLARRTGERLNAANDQLVSLQSSIGTVQAQVERATVEVATEADSLKITKARLVEVDPYQIAIELQNSETRLQSIYTMTARLSRLSLVEYL